MAKRSYGYECALPSSGVADDGERSQPDLGVQWLAYFLSEANYHMGRLAYGPLSRLWQASGREPIYFNYAYVAGWTAALILLVALTMVTPWALLLALIASFRYLEIVVWYLKLLFDASHALILSAERNLLFLVFDASACLVAVGLWLASATARAEADAPWTAAVATFTLNGAPSGFDGWRAALATTLGTFAGLLLIAAGLGLLISLLSERFRHGPAEGYTGPRRLTRPGRAPWSRQAQ